MRPLRWWAESAPPGWDRVKVSKNLGATAVAPVAPVDTSLHCIGKKANGKVIIGTKTSKKHSAFQVFIW